MENKRKKDRKGKRKLVRVLIILGCICGAGLLGAAGLNLLVVKRYGDRIMTVSEASQLQNVDCVMILGAKVREDGTPSNMLRDRMDRGLEVYESGATNRILVTGDHGTKEYDEVNHMKDYLAEKGVARDDIFMDHAGFSTYDSMYRARDVFQVKKLIIVTQRYHLYRALYIANELGLDAYGVAAEDIRYGGQAMRDFREVLARVKDVFTSIIQANPKYLGDVIPISGKGSLTDDK